MSKSDFEAYSSHVVSEARKEVLNNLKSNPNIKTVQVNRSDDTIPKGEP